MATYRIVYAGLSPGTSADDFWCLHVRVFRGDDDLGVWTAVLSGQLKTVVDRAGIDHAVFWARLAEVETSRAHDGVETGYEGDAPVRYQVTDDDVASLLREGRDAPLVDREVLRAFDW